MGDPSASIESPFASSTRTFALPDADQVMAAWADPPPGNGLPARPDTAKTICAVMLALGAALLLFVPVGGVLFLIAGALGLVVAAETTTVPSAPAKGAPSGPLRA